MLSIASLLTASLAHITMNPPVSTGSFSSAAVRVPHGCNETNTVAITVMIPKGVTSVKPQKIQGWVLEIKNRPLDVPVQSEGGKPLTEEVDTITWKEGNLPNNEYQDFGLIFKLPPGKDGDTF
jgi:periplasmic copper chaperone A